MRSFMFNISVEGQQDRHINICSYFKILRPANCFFAMFTTFVGFWYGIYDVSVAYLFLSLIAGFSTFLIAGGGYVINDFYDYTIDKINKPHRPLPSGQLTLFQAKIYAFVLFVLGIVLSIFTRNIFCIGIAVLNSILLYFYARKLKKVFLVGNLVVAWNACSTFIYGAILLHNIANIVPLAVLSLLYTIIREWVKCIEDFDGDSQNGVRSIATICGKEQTKFFCWLPISILMFSSLVLFKYQYIGVDLLVLLTIFLTIPLAIFSMSLFKATVSATISQIHNLMKFNMLLIVSIFVVKDILYRFYVL